MNILTHSCVGMPQGLQALLSSLNNSAIKVVQTFSHIWYPVWLMVISVYIFVMFN